MFFLIQDTFKYYTILWIAFIWNIPLSSDNCREWRKLAKFLFGVFWEFLRTRFRVSIVSRNSKKGILKKRRERGLLPNFVKCWSSCPERNSYLRGWLCSVLCSSDTLIWDLVLSPPYNIYCFKKLVVDTFVFIC